MANSPAWNIDTSMSIVYRALQKVGYPIFKPKLEAVHGTEHLPRKGGYVLAANHVDWLDGFYIATAIGLARHVPVYFLTKSNNYRWTTVTVQIPADRRASIVDAAAEYLQDGKIICNFIEGQRNTGRLLLPGKTGAVRMALAAGVPIVPVGITCRPGKTMAQSLMYLFSNKQAVRIHIGRAIHFGQADPATWSNEQLKEATGKVMESISHLSGKRN